MKTGWLKALGRTTVNAWQLRKYAKNSPFFGLKLIFLTPKNAI